MDCKIAVLLRPIHPNKAVVALHSYTGSADLLLKVHTHYSCYIMYML